MTESEITYTKEPWYVDHDLILDDNDEPIVQVRIDDDTLELVMLWAIGDDFESRAEYADFNEFYEETIAYWCDMIMADGGNPAAYHENGYEYFDIYTHLQKGGHLHLHDAIRGGEMYELTKDKLAYGIGKALDEFLCDNYDEGLDWFLKEELLVYDDDAHIYRITPPNNVDSEFGDKAIQLAIFDDLEYDLHSVRRYGHIRVHIPRFRPFANY